MVNLSSLNFRVNYVIATKRMIDILVSCFVKLEYYNFVLFVLMFLLNLKLKIFLNLKFVLSDISTFNETFNLILNLISQIIIFNCNYYKIIIIIL